MMSSFYGVKPDGTFDVMPGSDITSTIREAIVAATLISQQARDAIVEQLGSEGLNDPKNRADKSVTFEFNGVSVTVMPDSNAELVMRDWSRGLSGYLGENPVVGPYPSQELTEEELAKDAEIEAANQARRDAESARYRAEANEKHDRVTARMANAPEMEFSNEEAWLTAKAANENDPYGAGILSYAERWARMMQLEMTEGKSLEEVWSSTSFEADLEGMSGFSQGAATSLLTQSWVHGMELRRLHNAYWGSDSTDGTVNPAILTIGKKDD
jgi:hypothetical protein